MTSGAGAGKSALPECFYRLDSNDRIIDWGGPGWVGRVSGNLKGSFIYDHVAGHFTRRFVRDFFIRARATSEPARRNYRCDSHVAKRLMEMRAGLDVTGALLVEHRLLQESPLPFAIEILPAVVDEAAPFLRCSHCNRLKPRFEKGWREPEHAVGQASRVTVIHTICPDCWRRV